MKERIGSSSFIDDRIFCQERELVSVAGEEVGNGFESAYAYVQERAKNDQLMMSFEGGRARPYPIMSGVTCLNPSVERTLQDRIHTIHGALQKIVSSYHKDAGLRDFMNLPKELEAWVLEDSDDTHRKIDLCRFDMMGRSLSEIRIIEFNANAPGGILHGGMINTYWREAPEIKGLLHSWGGTPSPYEESDWFDKWLVDLARRRGLRDVESIGLLHPQDGNVLELSHAAQCIRRSGYRSAMITPSEWAKSRGIPFEVIYLKYGIQRAMKDMGLLQPFCRNVVEGKVIVPSSLSGRWIGDNKLCLAVMSDPKFHHMFDDGEKEAIRHMIPFSRKLGDGIALSEVADNKDQFVVKNPYGTRGASVYVGKDYSKDAWKELVKLSDNFGFVVQEYVDSSYATVDNELYRDLVAMIASGRIVGYGSRVSYVRKVNVAQEGRKMAVLSSI
jgi:hypothetical protein